MAPAEVNDWRDSRDVASVMHMRSVAMHWCAALCSCVKLLDIIDVSTGSTCRNWGRNGARESRLLAATALPSCEAMLAIERCVAASKKSR